jgi:hypothetical protein
MASGVGDYRVIYEINDKNLIEIGLEGPFWGQKGVFKAEKGSVL